MEHIKQDCHSWHQLPRTGSERPSTPYVFTEALLSSAVPKLCAAHCEINRGSMHNMRYFPRSSDCVSLQVSDGTVGAPWRNYSDKKGTMRKVWEQVSEGINLRKTLRGSVFHWFDPILVTDQNMTTCRIARGAAAGKQGRNGKWPLHHCCRHCCSRCLEWLWHWVGRATHKACCGTWSTYSTSQLPQLLMTMIQQLHSSVICFWAFFHFRQCSNEQIIWLREHASSLLSRMVTYIVVAILGEKETPEDISVPTAIEIPSAWPLWVNGGMYPSDLLNVQDPWLLWSKIMLLCEKKCFMNLLELFRSRTNYVSSSLLDKKSREYKLIPFQNLLYSSWLLTLIDHILHKMLLCFISWACWNHIK